MKKIKREKGITLIALVITIIVMLILVAVTINIAVNGGLFDYAGKAAKETESKKQAEQDWATLSENMSTEALIEKYTTDKEKDLANLKLFFVGKTFDDVTNDIEVEVGSSEEKVSFANDEVILDASTSIKYLIRLDGSLDIIIQYHKNFYKVIYDVDTRKATDVETFSEEEGNAIIAEKEKVTLTYGYGNNQKTTKISITEGETWYEWATDRNDTSDGLDLSGISTRLTLKSIIIRLYEENKGNNVRLVYTKNFDEWEKYVYCLVDSAERGPYNDWSNAIDLEDWKYYAVRINNPIEKGKTYKFMLDYEEH